MSAWLQSLPVAWAAPVSMLAFVALLILLWCFPARHIYGDAPDRARWRDLRIWGTALILIQLGIYWLFR